MLLARVAENLYWAARYLERAEGTARIVLEHTNLLVDLPTSVPLNWEPLLAITGSDEEFATRYHEAGEASIIEFLLAAEDHSGSLVVSVAQAREDLRVTRQVLPREAWETVNDLHLYVASHHAEGVSRPNRNRFLTRVIAECHRATGIFVGTMSRDDAYEFMRLGRNLERADMTTRVLDVRATQLFGDLLDGHDAHDGVQWTSVLRSLSALQMYHRTVRRPVDGPSTVQFLLTDTAFPRAVAHCLGEMTAVLEGLAVRSHQRGASLDGQGDLLAFVAAARARLRPEVAAAVDGPALREVVDRLQIAFAELHDAIATTHFAWTGASQSASQSASGEPSGG